jgi:hypothetical protein
MKKKLNCICYAESMNFKIILLQSLVMLPEVLHGSFQLHVFDTNEV